MNAGRYGTVHAAFWTDERVLRLGDRAKLLALYMLTGQHATAAGAMRLPSAYIEADLGWQPGESAQELAALVEIGFIQRHASGWTVIRNRLRYDPPANPNVAKSMVASIMGMPRGWNGWRTVAETLNPHLQRFKLALLDADEGLQPALNQPIDNGGNSGSGNGSANRSDNGMPNPYPTPQPLTLPLTPSHGGSDNGLPARRRRAAADAAGVCFAAWWSEYPRKVGRGIAERAYRNAVRKGATPELLADGLAKSKAHWARERTEERYIPHASTWLNQQRWEDEAPASAAEKPRGMSISEKMAAIREPARA